MKSNFIDNIIRYFNPEAGARRIQARSKAELMVRAYDAAKTFSTDDWVSATKGSANAELQGAQSTLREKGSNTVRNNSYGNKAVASIVSNTVGAGIVPHIKGRTKLQTKKVSEAWKEWGETTKCDSTGKLNFYSMQALALRTTVERGEGLALKEIPKEGHSLRLIESDHINSSKTALNIIQGVKLDINGKVASYFLYDSHPGEVNFKGIDREVGSDKVLHVYRIDRPGQLRGASWFHPVMRQLEDLNQYQQATLISRKIGACFSAFITTNNEDSTLSASDLKTKREAESMLEPGVIRYMNQGESVTLATPPPISGYDEFTRQTLRSIASGLGITYESLTSDYSQVNYSSGRMAHLEFRKNVDHWRWSILIPQFCEPAFKHFLDWCEINKGIDTRGVTVDWVPPSWSMLDPGKEISAVTDAMRSGLISYQKAVREFGYDPDETLQEIADHNEQLDTLKIKLDSDPRNITKAGLLQVDSSQKNNSQSGDNSSANQNQTVSTEGTSSQSN